MAIDVNLWFLGPIPFRIISLMIGPSITRILHDTQQIWCYSKIFLFSLRIRCIMHGSKNSWISSKTRNFLGSRNFPSREFPGGKFPGGNSGRARIPRRGPGGTPRGTPKKRSFLTKKAHFGLPTGVVPGTPKKGFFDQKWPFLTPKNGGSGSPFTTVNRLKMVILARIVL